MWKKRQDSWLCFNCRLLADQHFWCQKFIRSSDLINCNWSSILTLLSTVKTSPHKTPLCCIWKRLIIGCMSDEAIGRHRWSFRGEMLQLSRDEEDTPTSLKPLKSVCWLKGKQLRQFNSNDPPTILSATSTATQPVFEQSSPNHVMKEKEWVYEGGSVLQASHESC